MKKQILLYNIKDKNVALDIHPGFKSPLKIHYQTD